MKSKLFQKYMETLGRKSGPIPEKGWVGILIKTKMPSSTGYLESKVLPGSVDNGVQEKIAYKWLQAIGASMGMYGQGVFFALLPAEKQGYIDTLVNRVCHLYGQITTAHVFDYSSGTERQYTSNISTKSYYLPTVEEATDFMSMAHGMSLNKAVLEWYYRWMGKTGINQLVAKLNAEQPEGAPSITRKAAIRAIRRATPTLSAIKEILKATGTDELPLNNGILVLKDMSTGKLVVDKPTTNIACADLRDTVKSTLLLSNLPGKVTITEASTPTENVREKFGAKLSNLTTYPTIFRVVRILLSATLNSHWEDHTTARQDLLAAYTRDTGTHITSSTDAHSKMQGLVEDAVNRWTNESKVTRASLIDTFGSVWPMPKESVRSSRWPKRTRKPKATKLTRKNVNALIMKTLVK